ncbi:MAG: YiiD C-terminal domain-containing protein [Gammaproteobacteria bacterium]
MTRALGLRVQAYTGTELVLVAPLAGNTNHQSTAFCRGQIPVFPNIAAAGRLLFGDAPAVVLGVPCTQACRRRPMGVRSPDCRFLWCGICRGAQQDG